jgi:alkanesulfonate monooxygenase SsuD/methylene tetrahydromethanopterin reductase-like flavin-dependent oxidoreductase (luciferase family)
VQQIIRSASRRAARRRSSIGTGILLLPLHDPIRVAEDAAVVDVISAGRLELGFGAGYRVEELAAWGIAPGERGSRMNEAIPLIRRLFAGETVIHEGKHYRYGELSLRPVQRKVPIWIAGMTPPAVRRAARLADGFYGIGPIRPFVDEFKGEVERRGGDPDAHKIASALMYLHVTRDPERKWREALSHMAYQVNLYAKWGADAGLSTFSLVASRADLEASGCFIATPDRACGIVERFVEENQLTHLFSWTIPPGLPPEWSDEHVELMAREVIPKFR